MLEAQRKRRFAITEMNAGNLELAATRYLEAIDCTEALWDFHLDELGAYERDLVADPWMESNILRVYPI